ncbi:hypothetical protein BDW74DRAFT_180852 [Aspergillus multicolor]|uniref:uncharacterized protein n=1 Tax=Aspergillus multicolor TaxID=41759 RepID=UPI003CCE39CA
MSISTTTIPLSGTPYTFTNAGPLTTTFTPAPSCTSPDQMILGYITTRAAVTLCAADWLVQCTAPHHWGSACTPSGTPLPTTPPPEDLDISTDLSYAQSRESWDSVLLYGAANTYFSPGVVCPMGWETVGVAARDGRGGRSEEGFLAATTTISTATTTSTTATTSTGTDGYDGHVWYEYVNPVMALKEVLQPQETLAVCCPSGMSIDSTGYCYSFIPSYKPSYGCNVATDYLTELHETSMWTTIDGTVTQTDIVTWSKTTTRRVTLSTDIGSSETLYSGLMRARAITLLHRESDVEAASASASGSASDEPTDNAAGRPRLVRETAWEGVGAVVGIWTGRMVLGALMVLPW